MRATSTTATASTSTTPTSTAATTATTGDLRLEVSVNVGACNTVILFVINHAIRTPVQCAFSDRSHIDPNAHRKTKEQV